MMNSESGYRSVLASGLATDGRYHFTSREAPVVRKQDMFPRTPFQWSMARDSGFQTTGKHALATLVEHSGWAQLLF